MNALETAQEALTHDDDAHVVFNGEGTRWIGPPSDEDHDYHDLYAYGKDAFHGAC